MLTSCFSPVLTRYILTPSSMCQHLKVQKGIGLLITAVLVLFILILFEQGGEKMVSWCMKFEPRPIYQHGWQSVGSAGFLLTDHISAYISTETSVCFRTTSYSRFLRFYLHFYVLTLC